MWLRRGWVAQGILDLEFLMWYFSTSGHIVVPPWSSFLYTQQVCWGLEELVEKKRVLAVKRKKMQKQQEVINYSKATPKDTLRQRKIFHVTFEHSFLLMLVDMRDGSYTIKKACEQSWGEKEARNCSYMHFMSYTGILEKDFHCTFWF